MTYTFKLARRLARLRTVPALLLPLLAACAGADPTGISSTDAPPADAAVSPLAELPATPLALATAAASGSVAYNANLELGTWPSGTGIIQCASGRVKPFTAGTKPYTNAPTPRAGSWAVKFETRDTDYHCDGTSESRSQAESPRVMVQGGEYWLAESVYFPSDFPSIVKYYFMFTELYSPVGGGQPAVGLYLTNGPTPTISLNAAYNAATGSNKSVAHISRPKSQWIDLLIHIRISTNPSVGFIELYRNGANVPLTGGVMTNGASRLMGQTMLANHVSGGMAMIVNNYRSYANKTSSGKTVLYFDEIKIGATRAAVDPRATTSSQLLAVAP